MSLGRLFRTIAPLGATQLLHRLLRPVRGWPRALQHRAGLGPSVRLRRFSVPPRVRSVSGHWDGGSVFEFLSFPVDVGWPPDWGSGPTRLWNYHLHYLDELRDSGVDPLARTRLLDAWIRDNPFGATAGWESFPCSLRIVNTLEAFVSGAVAATDERAASVAVQAWWLEANLERDLGANHLLKNAFALAWAGLCFEGVDAERWRRRGGALLERELRGQILDDGFHYERSPGYHAVLVDDLLRLSALVEVVPDGDDELRTIVDGTLSKTAGALSAVLHPDGEIPLFNDAAMGQAPAASGLVRWSELDLGSRGESLDVDARGAVTAGLHVLHGESSVVIADFGEISCREQPGHAHADTLSFELSFERRRVLLDAGVFDYEPSEERRYSRSTRAHNTVTVDDLDQSEVWATFRVGRRAHPFAVRRGRGPNGEWLEGAHDGYRFLEGRPTHRRRIEQVGPDRWCIHDVVEGAGSRTIRARFRLAPGFEILAAEGSSARASDSCTELELEIEGAVAHVESGWYFERFGKKERCNVICLTRSGALPVEMRCVLSIRRR